MKVAVITEKCELDNGETGRRTVECPIELIEYPLDDRIKAYDDFDGECINSKVTDVRIIEVGD